MLKTKTMHTCTNCDAQFTKWTRRCLECGKWGAIEQVAQHKSTTAQEQKSLPTAKTTTLSAIQGKDAARVSTLGIRSHKKKMQFVRSFFLATILLCTIIATPQPTNAATQETMFNEVEMITQEPQPRIKIPGLNFTPGTEIEIQERDDGSYISIPFLGEYLEAIYKWSVAIAGVVAVIIILFSGVQMMLPGNLTTKGSGDQKQTINQAKKRIGSALIGLFLAVGSYTILYLVNPELVQFRNLSVQYVAKEPLKVTLSSPAYKKITGANLPPMTNEKKAEVIKMAGDIAEQAGIPRCLAETLTKFESGGNPAVIGHDENFPRATRVISSRIKFLHSGEKFSGSTFSPTPDSYSEAGKKLSQLKGDARTSYLAEIQISDIYNDDIGIHVDISKLNPPSYGIDWRYSHGFGIGQITCGGDGKPGCKKDGKDGCRVTGTCYTVPELLTIEGGLEAKVARLKFWYTRSCWGVPGGTPNTPQNNVDLNIIKKTIANWGSGCPSGSSIPWASTREKRFNTYKACIANGGTIVK